MASGGATLAPYGRAAPVQVRNSHDEEVRSTRTPQDAWGIMGSEGGAPMARPLALPGRPRPYVMAHRGNRVACPENTLASFRRAIADGAEILETELHLTSDGAFVCIHA